MKQRYLKILFAGLAIVFIPTIATAHGGFEKRAGDTVVYVTQSPISPYVGEQVTINMVFQQYNSLDRWKNLDVQIKLIDTYYGDESKDKVIFATAQTTDVNGSLNFSYAFPKENYFDVDLSFKNPITGKQEETGFLIQPRNENAPRPWIPLIFSIVSLVVGGAIGTLWTQRKRRVKDGAIL